MPNDPELGWVPQAMLVYVSFVYLTPLLGEFGSPRIWALSSLSLVVFLPMYFAAFWFSGWRRLWMAMGITVVGMALAGLNAGASVYFIYAAYFAGMSFEHMRQNLAGVAVVLAAVGVTTAWLAPNLYFAGPAFIGSFVLGLVGGHFSRRNLEIAELRMARAEIETLARIAERDRIAGDLHDLLGQTLSLIVLKSELAEALVSRDPSRAEGEAAEIRDIARRALSEVRTAVRGYRAGSGAGLTHELEGAREALAAAEVTLELDAGPERIIGQLDAAREGVLALALREASTNIIRHARARSCKVSFFDDALCYGVEIQDDGRGGAGETGSGLRGMRERVEAQGGTMQLMAEATGTRLRIEFSERPESIARKVQT